MRRLAIIATHPIQYYSPWFRYLAQVEGLEIKVFYLWNFGVKKQVDHGFSAELEWDIPLLDGYEHCFVANTSSRPGTRRFLGLRNPDLMKEVMRWNPDAVFLMAYRYYATIDFMLRCPRRIPLIFRGDSHRLKNDHRGLRGRIRSLVIRTIFKRFDAVLAVGKVNRKYFRMHGVKKARIFSSPHAVDSARLIAAKDQAHSDALAWKKELGIPAPHRVVLFAGKFVAAKRPADLIKAFARAKLRGTSLVMVGSGTLEDELRSIAHGIDHVHFIPFQNQSAMPRTLSLGDVLVLPSETETWGLILNEAMAFDKAIIASHLVGAAHDLVEPGRNGIVFRAGDVDGLTDALGDALSDDERLKNWGKRSGEIISRYTYAEATHGLMQALEFCAKEKRRRS